MSFTYKRSPLAFSLGLAAFGGLSKAQSAADFNWTALTPSTNLSWSPCYDSLECARFSVPLQYADPSGEEAAIAVIRSPSNFSSGDENYLGPLLFNPGGPGGSGVDFLSAFAPTLRQVLGPQYDLVSFDPRGVGRTTPFLNIFESAVEASLFYSTYPTNINESVSSLGRNYAMNQILGNLTIDRVKKVAESVSTPAVARDMLSIVKAFGQEKLQYWGYSYGTALGATFAAMFPDKIERMILDGVVNTHEYYTGNWMKFISDSDEALTSVFEACTAAGPDNCPLYEETPELVRDRLNAIFDKLHVQPLPVTNADPSAPALGASVVDYSTARYLLFSHLYFPYTEMLPLFAAYAGLEQGNATLFTQLTQSSESLGEASVLCAQDPSVPFVAAITEIQTAIACGDNTNPGQLTFDQAKKRYQTALDESEDFGPVVFGINAACSGWAVETADPFNASFTQSTSHPILFIGNTFDPITSLSSAHNMSTGFAGSVVLQQNITGHTTLAGLSDCAVLNIQNYFLNGTLPESGTVCQYDGKMFQLTDSATENPETGSVGARDLRATRDAAPYDFGKTKFVRDNAAARMKSRTLL